MVRRRKQSAVGIGAAARLIRGFSTHVITGRGGVGVSAPSMQISAAAVILRPGSCWACARVSAAPSLKAQEQSLAAARAALPERG